MTSTEESKVNILSLDDKIQLIRASEKNNFSVKKLCELFNCGKSQVYKTLKQKHEVQEQWKNGNGKMRRKPRSIMTQKINESIWEWYVSDTARNVQITGPMIKSKALEIAEKMSYTEFKASNGWLDNFKSRYNIHFHQKYYNSNSIDVKNVEEWNVKIKLWTEGYKLKDIYNGDETGLLFRALPTKTPSVEGLKYKGGQFSKERLTIFFCVNMEGEFEKPLVIGKEKNPKCLNKLDPEKCPIIWQANNKAWMTENIMEDWMLTFNNKLKKQNRKVILFLDNAACHPSLVLSNVRLAWLPFDVPSIVQPLNQGIIHSIKFNYRQMVLQSLLANNMDNIQNINESSKKINVLNAILWLNKSVNLIKPTTVKKCFIKAGFNLILDQVSDDSLLDNDFKELCSIINEEVDSEEYVNMDTHLRTNKDNKDTTNITRSSKYWKAEENSSDDENDNVPCTSSTMIGNDIEAYKNALSGIKRLEMLALNVNNGNKFLDSVFNVKILLENKIAGIVTTQKPLEKV